MTTRITDSEQPGSTDLLAVLTAVRPSIDIDQAWAPVEQAAVRERIIASTDPVDELSTRRRRARRPVVVLAVSGVVLAGGGGAAVAGGLMPQPFIEAFSYWEHPPENRSAVDPSTAERVASAPGPDGTVFTVVVAHAEDDPDYQCSTTLFETPDSASGPGPAAFTDASGSYCHNGSETAPFGWGGGVSVTDGYYVWDSPAGEAVRAELRTASGETYPVLRYGGTFFGWFPAPAAGDPHPELIGYAADGTEIGSEQI
jgi:hypothetical protein